MMKRLLNLLPIHLAFRQLPSPVLALMLLWVGLFLAGDLLVPDPVQLLDEETLAFVLYALVDALRFRRADGRLAEGADREARRELRAVPSTLSELESDVKALQRDVAGYRSGLADTIAPLPDTVRERRKRLAELDAFFARRENDPWSVERELRKRSRDVAAAEVDGDAARLEERRRAVDTTRMRLQDLDRRLDEREELITELERLHAEVLVLREQVRAVDQGQESFPTTTASVDADEHLAHLSEALREAHTADHEVDAAVRGRARRSS